MKTTTKAAVAAPLIAVLTTTAAWGLSNLFMDLATAQKTNILVTAVDASGFGLTQIKGKTDMTANDCGGTFSLESTSPTPVVGQNSTARISRSVSGGCFIRFDRT